VNVLDPGGADSHCTDGEGLPEAAAVNTPAAGAVTDWFVGCVVTVGPTGPELTVSVAAVVVAAPAVLLKTAS